MNHKYIKPKALVSNSLWSLFLTLLQIAVTFFLTPFLIFKLGIEFYGILILLLSISSFMSILSLGLGDTTLRYIAYYYGKKDIDSVNKVIDNTFFIFIVIGFFSFLIVYFNAENIVKLLVKDSSDMELLVELVKIIAVTVAIGFLGSSFSSIPQALQRYDIFAKVSIANNILYVAGTITILMNEGTIKALLFWNLINTIILQIMNFYIAKKLIAKINFVPRFNKKMFNTVFKFSFYTFMIHIFAIIQNHADKFLITSMVNVSSLSFLSIPQQLSFKGAMAINSIGKVLLPKFSTLNDKNEQKQFFLNSLWGLFIVSASLFVPFTLLLPDFLTLWINREFAEKSAFLAQIISASFILRGSFSAYAALFNGIGKAEYLAIIMFIMGVLSFIVNYILISKFGFYGLGYAYWVTPIVGLCVVFFTWFYIFREKNIFPIIHALIIPLIITIIIYFIFKLILSFFIIDLWFQLILIGLLIGLCTIIILISCEYFLDQNSLYIKNLFKVLKDKK